jgi:hypothetical protein
VLKLKKPNKYKLNKLRRTRGLKPKKARKQQMKNLRARGVTLRGTKRLS